MRRDGHVTPRLPDASPATQRRQLPVGMGGADRGAGWVSARAFEANRQVSILAIGRLLADVTIVVLGQVIGDDAVNPTIPTPCPHDGHVREMNFHGVSKEAGLVKTNWFAMLASEMNN